jgi:hypothetical protein
MRDLHQPFMMGNKTYDSYQIDLIELYQLFIKMVEFKMLLILISLSICPTLVVDICDFGDDIIHN